jgi:hypothetical protein
MFQCENQKGPAHTTVDEEQKTDSMEIDSVSSVSPAGDQRQQLAYVPTPPHTPATAYQENNDDEDIPMSDDLAEGKKTSEAPNKTINQAKKNVKRVNWEKTEDTKKSNSHMGENKHRNRTGFQESP